MRCYLLSNDNDKKIFQTRSEHMFIGIKFCSVQYLDPLILTINHEWLDYVFIRGFYTKYLSKNQTAFLDTQ